jgi:hypothetical protein
MRNGDFEGAWAVNDYLLKLRTSVAAGGLESTNSDFTRYSRAATPRHLQTIWDGTPLAGHRVLVRCYHGLGDTIQFIRYAPLIRQQAAELTVWAQPELLPLLRCVEGIDRLLPLHDGSAEVDYDVDVEIMELPYVFRSTLETIPASVPYLSVAPAKLDRDGSLEVGLVWRAGDWDERRSIPFSALEPLFELSGFRYWILQLGAETSEWREGFGTLAGSEKIEEAAAVMSALDLCITVDSMPAHLAGALGVPVWTLLHSEPDWRWMSARDDSPWYPTMRLFRQNQAGDWDEVVQRVAAALLELNESLCAKATGVAT